MLTIKSLGDENYFLLKLFLIVLEARKSKIKIRFLMRALFLPCRRLPSCCSTHGLSSACAVREGTIVSSLVSSYKGTSANPIMRDPTSRPHLNLLTSQMPHLQTLSHWGLELQHMNLGEETIQFIAINKHPLLQIILITYLPWNSIPL